MTPSEFLKEELFVGQLRYRRMEDQKRCPGLTFKHDFGEGRGLKLKVKKRKRLNWETC